MSGCAQAQANFYNLENFVGCRDCSMSHGRTTTHLPEASENKPTDWHQICRRSGRSVSHLLVCRIPFLCRCVYSCLSRSKRHTYSSWACIGLRWLLWACVDLRWPSLAAVGLRGLRSCFVVIIVAS